MTFVSVWFHELGHAAACVRGGARPGPIGCGLYLTMPVLFTDVTDSYRLARRHRLLVDLGGICFNGVAAVGFFVAYRSTGHAPFLVLVVVQHSIALQQLAPFVRLDGYWALSDLTGVPDLFRFMPTVLQGRRRHPDPLFDRLRVGPRRTIVVWAWATIVALVGQALFTLLLAVPLLRVTAAVIEPNLQALAHIVSDPVAGLSAAINLFFTCSPLIGLVLVTATLLRRFWAWSWARPSSGPIVRTALIASSALAVATPVVIGGRW
jgi:putative peptide zinc metalloprotease protein